MPAGPPPPSATDEPLADDPLTADLTGLQRALKATERAIACNPGLGPIYRELCRHVLATRPRRSLPEVEAALEACILELLGGPEGRLVLSEGMLASIRSHARVSANWRAPKGYRRHLPVPVWGDVLPLPPRSGRRDEDDPAEGGTSAAAEDGKTRKSRREDAPDVDRNDPLILNRFEKILSWAEFLRVNRGVDDEDEEQAKRAADDQEQITLVKSKRRPATKLKFDLDLAPADVDRDHLSGRFLYPEWDYRRREYLPDHCRVLASVAEESGSAEPWSPDAATRRRIEAVRRQFEALRPRREIARRQVDGSELDMDALIRARCDLAARGDATDRVYQQARDAARDLAVGVLIDVSRSTEAYVENRQVLDIAKESLSALTLGLTACGDEHALYSFSSCKRDRVWVQTVKSFTEPVGPSVLARIAHLRPGYYTRLGAAIRHVAEGPARAAEPAPTAVGADRRQAQRPRPLRRPLRRRGHGHGRSRGAQARARGLRHHHRPQGARLLPAHVRAKRLRHHRPYRRLDPGPAADLPAHGRLRPASPPRHSIPLQPTPPAHPWCRVLRTRVICVTMLRPACAFRQIAV